MRNGGLTWTPAEDGRLIELNTTLDRKALAKEINRSEDAIASRLSLLRKRGVDVWDKRNTGVPLFQKIQQGKREKIPCLGCLQDFMSENKKTNRLCYGCRSQGETSFTRSASVSR